VISQAAKIRNPQVLVGIQKFWWKSESFVRILKLTIFGDNQTFRQKLKAKVLYVI